VILLEVRVLIVDVQGESNALGNNARPASAVGGSLSLHLAVKDQLHLFGTAQIDILADDFLEEAAPVNAPFPDLSQRELGLQDGQIVAISGAAILGRERVREDAQLFAEEGVDLGGIQAVADPLSSLEIGAGQESVIESFEGDLALGQLALEIFMAIEAELGEVREVGAEFDEEGAEVLILAVEVVDVDQGGGVVDPGNGAALTKALANGARDADLLLGDADEDGSFLGLERAEVLFEDVVLALAFLESDQGDVLVVDEIADGADESVGHGAGCFGRGKAVAQVATEETGDAALSGELGEVGVEIHAVNALQLHDDVFALELGDRGW
jgi:hypothetical protein